MTDPLFIPQDIEFRRFAETDWDQSVNPSAGVRLDLEADIYFHDYLDPISCICDDCCQGYGSSDHQYTSPPPSRPPPPPVDDLPRSPLITQDEDVGFKRHLLARSEFVGRGSTSGQKKHSDIVPDCVYTPKIEEPFDTDTPSNAFSTRFVEQSLEARIFHHLPPPPPYYNPYSPHFYCVYPPTTSYGVLPHMPIRQEPLFRPVARIDAEAVSSEPTSRSISSIPVDFPIPPPPPPILHTTPSSCPSSPGSVYSPSDSEEEEDEEYEEFSDEDCPVVVLPPKSRSFPLNPLDFPRDQCDLPCAAWSVISRPYSRLAILSSLRGTDINPCIDRINLQHAERGLSYRPAPFVVLENARDSWTVLEMEVSSRLLQAPDPEDPTTIRNVPILYHDPDLFGCDTTEPVDYLEPHLRVSFDVFPRFQIQRGSANITSVPLSEWTTRFENSPGKTPTQQGYLVPLPRTPTMVDSQNPQFRPILSSKRSKIKMKFRLNNLYPKRQNMIFYVRIRVERFLDGELEQVVGSTGYLFKKNNRRTDKSERMYLKMMRIPNGKTVLPRLNFEREDVSRLFEVEDETMMDID